jgi:predicted HTH domain antitoxin
MENNKKQTAVEWFQEQIIKIVNGTCELSEIQIFDQAKEMEREQIKSAFTKGDLFAEDYFYPEKPNVDCSENYYNETFNKTIKHKG